MQSNISFHEIPHYANASFPYAVFHVNQAGAEPNGRGFGDFHWHDELQFTLVTNGAIVMQVNGREYPLEQGEGLFINCGLLHAAIRFSQNAEYNSINFPYRLLCFFENSYMEQQFVLPYIGERALPTTILRPSCPWQKRLLDLLWECCALYPQTTLYAREYHLAAKSTQIWQILLEHLAVQASAYPRTLTSRQHRIQSMLSFIHTHYMQDLSLADIAASANISQSECCRCFREFLHISPRQYLIRYRLKQSLPLLGSQLYSIALISEQCGFYSPSHYIAQFKKQFGLPPGAYRAHLK